MLDTPLNGRKCQSLPAKRLPTSDDVDTKNPIIQGTDLAGHVKAESLGQIETTAMIGTTKNVPTSEEARKLRQAQQKLRKEQWRKKFDPVAVPVGVVQGVGSTVDPELVSDDMKWDMELMSNGEWKEIIYQ